MSNMRVKVLGKPRDTVMHPLAHQIGNVLVEGKDGVLKEELDEKTGKTVKRFQKFKPGDPRRLYVLRFGYSSIHMVDYENVYKIEAR
jgi:hypothetical protein